MKHLLINPTVSPEDYIGLCGYEVGKSGPVFEDEYYQSTHPYADLVEQLTHQPEFTTDINDTNCPECIEAELHFVNNDTELEAFADMLMNPEVWDNSDEKGEPLFI